MNVKRINETFYKQYRLSKVKVKEENKPSRTNKAYSSSSTHFSIFLYASQYTLTSVYIWTLFHYYTLKWRNYTAIIIIIIPSLSKRHKVIWISFYTRPNSHLMSKALWVEPHNHNNAGLWLHKKPLQRTCKYAYNVYTARACMYVSVFQVRAHEFVCSRQAGKPITPPDGWSLAWWLGKAWWSH